MPLAPPLAPPRAEEEAPTRSRRRLRRRAPGYSAARGAEGSSPRRWRSTTGDERTTRPTTRTPTPTPTPTPGGGSASSPGGAPGVGGFSAASPHLAHAHSRPPLSPAPSSSPRSLRDRIAGTFGASSSSPSPGASRFFAGSANANANANGPPPPARGGVAPRRRLAPPRAHIRVRAREGRRRKGEGRREGQGGTTGFRRRAGAPRARGSGLSGAAGPPARVRGSRLAPLPRRGGDGGRRTRASPGPRELRSRVERRRRRVLLLAVAPLRDFRGQRRLLLPRTDALPRDARPPGRRGLLPLRIVAREFRRGGPDASGAQHPRWVLDPGPLLERVPGGRRVALRGPPRQKQLTWLPWRQLLRLPEPLERRERRVGRIRGGASSAAPRRVPHPGLRRAFARVVPPRVVVVAAVVTRREPAGLRLRERRRDDPGGGGETREGASRAGG